MVKPSKGPRQAAYLMGTTTTSPSPLPLIHRAQAFFNQALVSCMDSGISRPNAPFVKFSRFIPAIRMAYWGMAMANANNRPRPTADRKSRGRREQVSNRERLWIDTMAAYLKESDSKNESRAHQGLSSPCREIPQ